MKSEKDMEKSGVKRFGAKALVITGVCAVALNVTIGGTIAWLISQTDPVTNTFTYGDINITLTETDSGDNDGDASTNTYEMVPGKEIAKDPLITVEADSEDCWLFAQITESEGFDSFIEYTAAEGWTALDGEDGVYYREVAKSEDAQEFYVIAENTVKVKEDVTKEMLNSLGEDGSISLTVTAYAVQRDGEIEAIDTAAEAWALTQK